MSEPLRVLCVCSHNRTRSVLAAALLSEHCGRVGVAVDVGSAGFAVAGEPATGETVRLLRERGLDVAGHRSRRIDPDLAADHDLIVTAQHDHVVHISGRTPELFGRTFTLPELVARAEPIGRRSGRSISNWLADVGRDRPSALDYLDAGDAGIVGEIADPTGGPPREWAAAISTIDDLAARLAGLLA